MPYEIKKQGGKHCVVKKSTGKTVPGGCHKSQPDAAAHLYALHKNVKN